MWLPSRRDLHPVDLGAGIEGGHVLDLAFRYT